MKYTYSTLQDFLQDDSFVRWILFGEQDLFWENFTASYPEKASLLFQAKELILLIRKSEDRAEPEIDKTRLWERIQKNVRPQYSENLRADENKSVGSTRLQRLSFFGVSFIVLIIGGLFWLNATKRTYQTYDNLVANSEKSDKRIEKYNPNKQPLLVTLEDGSFISLKKNARINYPRHFNDQKREVILSGEAFFQIFKNPAKPFYVYSNGCVTKVLGTSFDIRTDDDKKQVTVNVRSGMVSVFGSSSSGNTDPEKTGVVLLPNQLVVFDQQQETLIRKIVDQPQRISPLALQTNKHFDEVPVTDILKTIEELYGLKLLYSENQLSNCIITTTLTNDPLYDQLNIICKIIGATYKEIDAQIIIESPGC